MIHQHLLSFLLLFMTLYSSAQTTGKPVWVDTDNRMGKVFGDVDDGLALLFAFTDSSKAIRGISTVKNPNYAEKITKKLLQYSGREKHIPVYKGVGKKNKIHIETEGVKALADALTHERVTILALGPATNIASLIQLYPEVIPKIEQIIFCMGASPGSRFSPEKNKHAFSDYNFVSDPDALQNVLKTNIPLVFAGYEAASTIFLNKNDVQKFRNTGQKGDKWVYRQLKSWCWKWNLFFNSKKGFIPFDAVTTGYLQKPDLLRCAYEIPVAIEADEQGKKHRLLLSPEIKSEKKATFCNYTQVAFKEYLLEKLLNSSLD